MPTCRSLKIFLQPSSTSALFHGQVWFGSVRLTFKVTSEVGDKGVMVWGMEIR